MPQREALILLRVSPKHTLLRNDSSRPALLLSGCSKANSGAATVGIAYTSIAYTSDTCISGHKRQLEKNM